MKLEPKKALGKRMSPTFAVVGIGFSAGGWPALLQIVKGIEPDSGMAFVVILHLSPDFESNASEVISSSTKMRVKQVNGPTLIEPDNIYILPPSKLIRMYDGHLDVRDFERPIGALLLASGAKNKRYCLPNSRVMIHQPLGGFQGQASDIEIHAKEILYLRERLNRILSSHTGKPLDEVDRDTDRDNFMSAEQAVGYGLVDRVIANRADAA